MKKKKLPPVSLTQDPREPQIDPTLIPPEVQDEEWVGGSMPDPEINEDTLEMSQDVGLYEDAKEDEPEELDIAGQVEKAEKSRHGNS